MLKISEFLSNNKWQKNRIYFSTKLPYYNNSNSFFFLKEEKVVNICKKKMWGKFCLGFSSFEGLNLKFVSR